MDERIEAIRQLRLLAGAYASGSVTLGDFVAGTARLVRVTHPFGPYDWQEEDTPPPLGTELEAEVSFYIEWSHHHRDKSYRRADWVYGSGGEYDWLDMERYHADFAEALGHMRLEPLPDEPEEDR
jgi:hypothetical protein